MQREARVVLAAHTRQIGATTGDPHFHRNGDGTITTTTGDTPSDGSTGIHRLPRLLVEIASGLALHRESRREVGNFAGGLIKLASMVIARRECARGPAAEHR